MVVANVEPLPRFNLGSNVVSASIGLPDGGSGEQLPPPPIRADSRHQFGQRVDIYSGKTQYICLINTS